MRPHDLSTKRFGRLLVLHRDGSVATPGGTKRSTWRCLCDCGTEKVIRGQDLVAGVVASCGCLLRDATRARRLTHGRTDTREYRAWASAKKRCTNPKEIGYENYGGRGIRMCDRWLNSFEAFYADMGACPPDLSLDRKDVNGHYEPENCRWATRVEQHNNTRQNRFLVFRGERMTVAQAARRAGVHPSRVYGRLNNGWSVEDALAS